MQKKLIDRCRKLEALVRGHLNLRCFNYPDQVHPLSRYVNGLLELKRPGELVYAAITGIPSDMAVWDRMLDKYLTETNAQEKLKLLRGLASVKDPWMLYRLVQVHSNCVAC